MWILGSLPPFYFIDYPSPGDGDTHTQGRSSLFSFTSLKSSSEICFHNNSKVNQIDVKASKHMAFLTLLSDSYSSFKSCVKVNYLDNKQEAGDTFLILGFCSSLATGFSSKFAKETIPV